MYLDFYLCTFFSLKTFFNKARDMVYFKRLIQIPRLPDVSKNSENTMCVYVCMYVQVSDNLKEKVNMRKHIKSLLSMCKKFAGIVVYLNF